MKRFLYFVGTLLIIFLLILIYIGTERGKYNDETRNFEAQIEKLSVLYMDRYEGGKAIVETETYSYRTTPRLVTNDLKPTKCLEYNICPEGNLITKTRIKKVSMPDDSASLDCGEPYLLDVVENGRRTKVPNIFYDNQWGPKAYRCNLVSSVDSLRYAIHYQKNLATVYSLCSDTYGGDIYYQVNNGNVEAWAQCVISNVDSWKTENGGFPYLSQFNAAVLDLRKSCSVEFNGEEAYYPSLNMNLEQLKIWNQCVVSKAQLILEEKK